MTHPGVHNLPLTLIRKDGATKFNGQSITTTALVDHHGEPRLGTRPQERDGFRSGLKAQHHWPGLQTTGQNRCHQQRKDKDQQIQARQHADGPQGQDQDEEEHAPWTDERLSGCRSEMHTRRIGLVWVRLVWNPPKRFQRSLRWPEPPRSHPLHL